MRRSAFCLAAAIFATGCPERALPCTSGASAACTCTNGQSGAQTCGAGGTFGACVCEGSQPDARVLTDAAASDAAPDAAPTRIAGVDLLSRLGGLWTGPATGTPLGDLPLMNMDFRAATARVLFGRVDLDAQNALRFAFAVETIAGADVLVFRNGGYFAGIERDTRTRLVDVAGGSYHFCAIERGCDYVDARFTFESAEQLVLDVAVMRTRHLTWRARRAELRSLPNPFPADEQPQGSGMAPFPTLPRLVATVTWSAAVTADTQALVILTATPCGVTASCTASRSLFVTARAGATSVVATFEQLLPGAYYANVILDRNHNFASTLRPDSGDGVAAPDTMVTVANTGDTAVSLPVVYTLP